MSDEDKTYKVIRFYSDSRERQVVETGLTRDEAKDICDDDETEGLLEDGTKWFLGFDEE